MLACGDARAPLGDLGLGLQLDANLRVEIEHRLAAYDASADEVHRHAQHRIAFAGEIDLRLGAVSEVGVAASVAEKARAREMKHSRTACAANVAYGGLRSQVRLERVPAPCGKIAKVWLGLETRLDPPFRRAGADPQTVVFTDEQERNRQPLMHAPAGGVDRAKGGAVIQAGIAEAR